MWLDQGGVAQEDGLKCGLIRVVWPRRMDWGVAQGGGVGCGPGG